MDDAGAGSIHDCRRRSFLGLDRWPDRTVLAIAKHLHRTLDWRWPDIAKAKLPEQIALVAGAVVIYLIFRAILAFWRRAGSGPTSPLRSRLGLEPGSGGDKSAGMAIASLVA